MRVPSAPKFRLVVPLVAAVALTAGCESRERCDHPHDGGAYGGTYQPVRLKDGASLASRQSCQSSSDCSNGLGCDFIYLETCFTEPLCGVGSELFECPDGYRQMVLESDPGQIVCSPNR